jgi:hypothetical protein
MISIHVFFLMKIWLLRGVLAMTHLFGLKPTPEIETRKKEASEGIYIFSQVVYLKMILWSCQKNRMTGIMDTFIRTKHFFNYFLIFECSMICHSK